MFSQTLIRPNHPVGWVRSSAKSPVFMHSSASCSPSSPAVTFSAPALCSNQNLCGIGLLYSSARRTTAGGTVDFQLNEEQLHLKKSVREFAEREIKPNVMKWDEAGEFPAGHRQRTGQARIAGNNFSSRVRRRGHGLRRIRHRDRGTLARRRIGWHYRRRPHLALLQPHFSRRQRSAEKEIRQQTGHRRIHRRVGIDRAFVRFRCRQRPHDRRAQGKQLGAEWHQDFLHQRPLRRRRRRAGRDRSRRPHARHLGVRGRERYQGISSRQKRKQTWPARQRHRRTDFRRLRDSRRKSARRRRPGISRRHARSRRRPHLDCRAVARHGRRRATRPR